MRTYHAFRIAAALSAIMLVFAGSGLSAKSPKAGGGGKTNNTAPKFDVTVTQHPSDVSGYLSGDNLWAPGVDCVGETPDAMTKDIVTLVFFHHQLCAKLVTSDGTTLTDDLTIHTNTDSNGDIVSIWLTGQDVIDKAGITYISDPIPLSSPVTPNRIGFTIHAHASNVGLHNCHSHLIKHNTVCDADNSGTFSIDDVNYNCISYCQAAATIESTIRYWPGNEPQ